MEYKINKTWCSQPTAEENTSTHPIVSCSAAKYYGEQVSEWVSELSWWSVQQLPETLIHSDGDRLSGGPRRPSSPVSAFACLAFFPPCLQRRTNYGWPRGRARLNVPLLSPPKARAARLHGLMRRHLHRVCVRRAEGGKLFSVRPSLRGCGCLSSDMCVCVCVRAEWTADSAAAPPSLLPTRNCQVRRDYSSLATWEGWNGMEWNGMDGRGRREALHRHTSHSRWYLRLLSLFSCPVPSFLSFFPSFFLSAPLLGNLSPYITDHLLSNMLTIYPFLAHALNLCLSPSLTNVKRLLFIRSSWIKRFPVSIFHHPLFRFTDFLYHFISSEHSIKSFLLTFINNTYRLCRNVPMKNRATSAPSLFFFQSSVHGLTTVIAFCICPIVYCAKVFLCARHELREDHLISSSVWVCVCALQAVCVCAGPYEIKMQLASLGGVHIDTRRPTDRPSEWAKERKKRIRNFFPVPRHKMKERDIFFFHDIHT